MRPAHVGLTLLLLVFLVGAWFVWELARPADGSGTVDVSIAAGETEAQIAAKLTEQGLIRNQFVFDVYVWFRKADRQFRSGTHAIARDASIVDVVRSLTVETRDEVSVRLLEGWTKEEMATALADAAAIEREAFLVGANATDSRTIVPGRTFPFLSDKPNNASLEGYLFPDTYRFFQNATITDVLTKLLANFEEKFDGDLERAIRASGRTTFEVVTMASIVEGEVRTAADRPVVAGIFWKRLANGIPLQSDATVNYATGKSRPQASAEDLTVDSLYNTYKYRGLPPGPIGNPSLAALRAAASPEDSPYLYFLTKPDGEVAYGKTLEEHNENKAKYLK